MILRPDCTGCGLRPRARPNGGAKPTLEAHLSLCYLCRQRDRDTERKARYAERVALGLSLLDCFGDEEAARSYVAEHHPEAARTPPLGDADALLARHGVTPSGDVR